MSLNAATIAVLVGKGMSADDILEIAIASEAKADPTNAARQARFRAKRKAESNAVTVTEDRVSNDRDILTFPDSPQVVSNETTPPGKIELKPEHVVEAWNDLAQGNGLREVRKLTPQRRRKLALRIRQNSIDEFTEAIAAIGRSPFLRGENDRGWRANFDWMLEPANFTKLTEGNYDR